MDVGEFRIKAGPVMVFGGLHTGCTPVARRLHAGESSGRRSWPGEGRLVLQLRIMVPFKPFGGARSLRRSQIRCDLLLHNRISIDHPLLH
ncbi:hypothetical protein CVU37_12390 [candidate division BRC1 bacterium HGW-BRC1-1]|nr:MAG: hypothetical protein CVU37_12390 [candidate division BRC1 bacterium HGW-BRC1-1]